MNLGKELDAKTEDVSPLIWELQYLYSESEEERFEESERKLRLIRELILSGADPDPVCDGEELLYYVRYRLNDGIEDYPERLHCWGMEHLIEAHAYGETERFFEKLKTYGVKRIMVSDWAFWLIDEDQCECDHAIFEFEDGESMMLSSYQAGDDDWAFYAVSVSERFTETSGKYREILPEGGLIRYRDFYVDELDNTSRWLDLYIDDAVLRIRPDELTIMMRVGSFEGDDYQLTKRRRLF